jgi:hypothetical protein
LRRTGYQKHDLQKVIEKPGGLKKLRRGGVGKAEGQGMGYDLSGIFVLDVDWDLLGFGQRYEWRKMRLGAGGR